MSGQLGVGAADKAKLLDIYYEAFKDKNYAARAIWSAIGAIIYLGLATALIYLGITHGGDGYLLAGAGVVISMMGAQAAVETCRLVTKAWQKQMFSVK